MPEYYRVDNRKITLREYLNIARSWKGLLAWIAARLGNPIQSGAGFHLPESVAEMEMPESEFPPQAREKLSSLLQQCGQLGFHSPRFYQHGSLRRDVRTAFISMAHRSGELTLRLMYTRAENGTVVVENILAVLLSELNDGTFFVTSDQAAKFKGPPTVLINRQVGASPLQLIQSHQDKLAQVGMRNPPKPVLSTAALDDLWNRYENLSRDFQVQRGLYVRMTPEEVERQQKMSETARTLTTDGVPHAEVLVELNQLQNKKAGWSNAIWIFLLSMLLFVGAGSRQWSWEYVLILVPVLFVHELGHYIAMRAFNYRNLRMFFIPFFGAAVAGQHYNVPGWKKVIVSMMGPAPGILLGAIIGGAGLVLHQPWLIKVALVALILNGFNLLPVLPLDGGWVFHALLFSRHHLLDAAFRVVAAIALIAGGMFSKDKILMYLGVFMLIGIPAAYRMARITSTLRQRRVPTGSPDDQTIPTETAVAIIDELKKSLPKRHTTKMVAQQALQIFETLNARPPGWLATSSLLFAYITSLGMAAVFAGVFIIGQRGDFRAVLAATANQPKRALACGTSLSWKGDQVDTASETPPVTIIANFPKRSDAMNSFKVLTNQLPPSVMLTLFGDSLFLTLPSGEGEVRKQWFSELQHRTKEVFVDSTNYPTTLSASCRLANESLAKELETELNEYFSNDSTQSLIPPWLPRDRRTAEERAAHRLARKTYLRAQTEKWEGYSDPKVSALQKRIAEARRQGDEAEARTLTQQMTELANELGRQRLNKLKSGEEGPMDTAVIDLLNTLPATMTKTNRDAHGKVLEEIAHRLGQLSRVNDGMAPSDHRFSTRGGSVRSKGHTLHLGWLSFKSISEGAPALIDWLCAKGCTDLKYDIRSGTGFDQDETP